MKKGIIYIWIIALSGVIISLFWYNELVYSLPTPIPVNYKIIANGKVINEVSRLKFNNSKPIFLHFFNPDCPCSRFNISHFKSLVKQYGNRVNFAVVLMTDKYYSAGQVKSRFDLNVPVIVDPNLAIACGVYSTPQAAIINADYKLYYRGNYNRSRYCTDERSEYAKMAVEGLLQHNTHLVFNKFALTAYGCSLPNCKN